MAENVPFWGQLPDYVQRRLTVAGYHHSWFDTAPPVIRLTVLNISVKLSGMGLWHYVSRPTSTTQGCLEFMASTAAALKRELNSRPEFTFVSESGQAWACREKKATCTLHFKHFSGWSPDQVQAHIDRVGLMFGGKWSPPVLGPLVMGLPHLHDSRTKGWQEVFDIRDMLLKEGWDPRALLGIDATWLCGARGCPSHEQPGDRCPNGRWACGRRQPACPGQHTNPTDPCRAGSAWSCGARDCPATHPNASERCNPGIWYCGRKQPACPGHSVREKPCDSAAVFLFRR